MNSEERFYETQDIVAMGRTYFMWKNGSTNAEIAECLRRPIEQVNEWVEMCKYTDAIEVRKSTCVCYQIR